MAELMQIYKCNACTNMVEVINPGIGILVCCNQEMELMSEKTEEESFTEKHKPVITMQDEQKTIRVGQILHPMEENHYIMFIEAMSPDKRFVKRKYLKPHEIPELVLKCKCEKIIARAMCNLHGLWRSEND